MRKLGFVLAFVLMSFAVHGPAKAQTLECNGFSEDDFNIDLSGSGSGGIAGAPNSSFYFFFALRPSGDAALFGFFTGGRTTFQVGTLSVNSADICLLIGSLTDQVTGQVTNYLVKHEGSFAFVSTAFDSAFVLEGVATADSAGP